MFMLLQAQILPTSLMKNCRMMIFRLWSYSQEFTTLRTQSILINKILSSLAWVSLHLSQPTVIHVSQLMTRSITSVFLEFFCKQVKNNLHHFSSSEPLERSQKMTRPNLQFYKMCLQEWEDQIPTK